MYYPVKFMEKSAIGGRLMKEQFYYLRGDPFFHYSDNSVPVHIKGAGYYYNVGKGSAGIKQNIYWRLQVMDCKPASCEDPAVMEPRQFVLRKANTPYFFSLGENAVTGYYWVQFCGNYVNQLVENCGLEPNRIYTLQESQMEVVRRNFDRMFREFILRLPGYEDMLASQFAHMIVQLGRFVRKDSPEDMKNRLRKQMEQSVIYIHNHYMEELSVATLADIAALSERRFRQVFREAFDMAPSEYIMNLRISYAEELLRDTTLPVGQIAESCGYHDALYFSRLFHQKTGMSPLTYRKSTENK